MAHFAQLDENNNVLQVIVVSNEELLLDGIENENKGIMFCKSLFGEQTKWIQTSYNNKFRKQYAGIDFSYDATNDVFIAPRPFPSWVLNENFDWVSPISKPDGVNWFWDEMNQNWVEEII